MIVTSILVFLGVVFLLFQWAYHKLFSKGEGYKNFRVSYECPKEFEELNKRVQRLIQQQISRNAQAGVQVAAFWKGQQIVNVYGGGGRFNGSTQWSPIKSDTIFMAYSVSKGIAAATLASILVVDPTHIPPSFRKTIMQYNPKNFSYVHKISQFWKKFDKNGKQDVTIEEAISHRAGLTKIPIWRLLWNYMRGGKDLFWKVGCEWIADYNPEWIPGTDAIYHPVSWSWIIGGIVQHISGLHISQLMQQTIAKPLGQQENMFLGEIPKELHPRICQWENLWTYQTKPELSLLGNLKLKILCYLEIFIFTKISNTELWKNICLPSSNGFFTATALAKTYYALISKPSPIILPGTQEYYLSTLADRAKDLKSPRTRRNVRYSLGWNLEPAPKLHGAEARSTLCHEGLGGCTAFADPTLDLSVAILSNSYRSYVYYTTITDETSELANCVRDFVKEHTNQNELK